MDLVEYKKRLVEINTEHSNNIGKLHSEFALSNSPVLNGGFITDHIGTIKVDKIRVTMGFGSVPECVYSGYCYTKTGKPFKNGEYRDVWQSNLK